MAHYLRGEVIVGWGPAVEEIDYLSRLFTTVRHLGCLHSTKAPNSSLPYRSDNLTLIPVPPAGGNSFRDKLVIIKLIPLYISTIVKELAQADVVHLRCPANIPLLALLIMIFIKKPAYRWTKFAGNWVAGSEYPFFYRFQRWLLKTNLSRSVVTVNGHWSRQKPFIHSFYNPCLTEDEMRAAKSQTLHKEFSSPVRLIFVGALNEKKGLTRLLEIACRLKSKQIKFFLDLLGDGPLRNDYEKVAMQNGLQENVLFHGWIPKNEIGKYYTKAHLNVFPSSSEGWPKVLSEGMAYGVVPLAGSVSSIPQILDETKAGITVSPLDVDAYVNEIESFVQYPEKWNFYSVNARTVAEKFTYENYLIAVQKLFEQEWGLELSPDSW